MKKAQVELKVEWYVISRWGYAEGPFKEEYEAKKYVDDSRDPYTISEEEYRSYHRIIPQVVKLNQLGGTI